MTHELRETSKQRGRQTVLLKSFASIKRVTIELSFFAECIFLLELRCVATVVTVSRLGIKDYLMSIKEGNLAERERESKRLAWKRQTSLNCVWIRVTRERVKVCQTVWLFWCRDTENSLPGSSVLTSRRKGKAFSRFRIKRKRKWEKSATLQCKCYWTRVTQSLRSLGVKHAFCSYTLSQTHMMIHFLVSYRSDTPDEDSGWCCWGHHDDGKSPFGCRSRCPKIEEEVCLLSNERCGEMLLRKSCTQMSRLRYDIKIPDTTTGSQKWVTQVQEAGIRRCRE